MRHWKKAFFGGLTVVMIILFAIILLPGRSADDHEYYMVSNGEFEIIVMVTGELEAENSTLIEGPSALQSRYIRLRNIPIQDMVPEGTIVEEGDWVATLDRTEAELSLSELEERMLTEKARYNSATLDTAILLNSLRDELVNMELTAEEMQLVLEQSVYEPPATIRQAEIDLERAERNLRQARENYGVHLEDAVHMVREARLEYERRVRRYHALDDIMDDFYITAPRTGMIIYHREWDGEKRIVGSTIHSRDLIVAVMPELSSLVSRTYVNEMDIHRVMAGQPVRIGVDAFPGREYPGTVIEVSNVGQEMPNTDAKVFEVLIMLERTDELLRPAMTSSNAIITGHFDDVYYVPLAAVHDNGGISYVYKDDGTRQITITGPSNDNFIIIEEGLVKGDQIYLEAPLNGDDFEFVGQELIAGN
jgi:HlyD family secretion protein